MDYHPSSKQRSWTISIHAKHKKVELKLSGNCVLLDWGKDKAEKIRLLLRIRHFFLEVKTVSRNLAQREIPKSKFSRLLERLFKRKRRRAVAGRVGSTRRDGGRGASSHVRISRISLSAQRTLTIWIITLACLFFYLCEVACMNCIRIWCMPRPCCPLTD